MNLDERLRRNETVSFSQHIVYTIEVVMFILKARRCGLKSMPGFSMRVKCVICDSIETIEDFCVLAKKLRNRPIHTFMCDPCQTRITERTGERKATGRFQTPHIKKEESEWL